MGVGINFFGLLVLLGWNPYGSYTWSLSASAPHWNF